MASVVRYKDEERAKLLKKEIDECRSAITRDQRELDQLFAELKQWQSTPNKLSVIAQRNGLQGVVVLNMDYLLKSSEQVREDYANFCEQKETGDTEESAAEFVRSVGLVVELLGEPSLIRMLFDHLKNKNIRIVVVFPLGSAKLARLLLRSVYSQMLFSSGGNTMPDITVLGLDTFVRYVGEDMFSVSSKTLEYVSNRSLNLYVELFFDMFKEYKRATYMILVDADASNVRSFIKVRNDNCLVRRGITFNVDASQQICDVQYVSAPRDQYHMALLNALFSYLHNEGL